MSRETNNLQRHVEECLEERHAMREWLRRAREIAVVHVSERDWLLHGHQAPEEWLQGAGLEDDWDEFWDDWGDETHDAPELSKWDALEWFGGEHCELERSQEDYDDWREEYWEPPDLEYGGQHYPRADVQAAREFTP